MSRTSRSASILALALLAGCATHKTATPGAPTPVAAATPAQQAALLDRVKALQGTWQIPAHDGLPESTIVFAVTANGSAVREIMFPGTPMEMTNLYHMDGPTMIMTHYCAMGNQPRVRAVAGGPHDPIDLKFDGVTNLSSPDQSYMGGLKLTIKDADHIEEAWTSYKAGQSEGEHAAFQLTRKK
jgi:hypothetical protein